MRNLVLIFLLISSFSLAQNNTNKEQIRKMMTEFLDCIKTKDSAKFYSLFHDDPIVWIGVYKDRSYQKILMKNPEEKQAFSDTYKEFMQMIGKNSDMEEKYDNVKIIEDGNVASANFDYSFWYKGKMQNWGKEIWTLVKINGVWKITTVIFSMDMTEYYHQPSLKERLKQ